MNEIEDRLHQAALGRRDLQADYESACEAVKRTHKAFQAGRGAKGKMAPQPVQDAYAKALRELDIATRCLQLSNAAAA